MGLQEEQPFYVIASAFDFSEIAFPRRTHFAHHLSRIFFQFKTEYP